MHRGKWVVVILFLLAISAAWYAWNHQRRRGQRILAYLGQDAALLIRHGSEVHMQRLEPSRPMNGILEEGGSSALSADDWMSISDVPGIIHGRQALVEDRAYDWTRLAPDVVQCTHVLRFRHDGKTAILWLDLEDGWLRIDHQQKCLSLTRRMCAGWREFLQGVRQFESVDQDTATVAYGSALNDCCQA